MRQLILRSQKSLNTTGADLGGPSADPVPNQCQRQPDSLQQHARRAQVLGRMANAREASTCVYSGTSNRSSSAPGCSSTAVDTSPV